MDRRIMVLLITTILVTISVFPASAHPETTVISGTCVIYKWGGGGEGELPTDTKYRMWEPEGMAHWRNQWWLFWCDYDDERLDGFLLVSDNWNLSFHENNEIIARTFGQSYSADADGNILGLWEGTYEGWVDQAWNTSMKINFKGLGIYHDLMAQLTMSYTTGDAAYIMQGELKNTGN